MTRVFSRRSVVGGALAIGTSGLVAVAPRGAVAADRDLSPDTAAAITSPVKTRSGLVRGTREHGISAFRGIPYGADTGGQRRFLAPVRPEPWRGVRDCFRYGHRAPQGSVGANRIPPGVDPARLAAIMAAFKEGQVATGNESEDCLFLNVFTADTRRAARRPVMVWLHGGGFAMGSGGEAVYEGGKLAARGDVVVVTINHRLGAPGYLYLAAFDPRFRDSGMAGQLDQVLALEWVRDNIARFGGDPANVTIFGESGGGAKVSTLLAMPAARGLFHKAIIQSGPSLKGLSKDEATAFAGKVLHHLGIPAAEAARVQTIALDRIMTAVAAVQAQIPMGGRVLAPVVDGINLPADPFDPVAPAISAAIPLIIGSNKDEATLFSIADPKFGTMTEDDARSRFARALKDLGDKAFTFYREQRPTEQPTWLVTAMLTESGTWINSIRLAERKAARQQAPVFMYRLDYETPIFGGILRSPHGLDTPMVFGHAREFARMLGDGPEPARIGDLMMDAWIAFARTGDPSTPAHSWPAYDPASRQTMIFAPESRVITDPDKPFRLFWSG